MKSIFITILSLTTLLWPIWLLAQSVTVSKVLTPAEQAAVEAIVSRENMVIAQANAACLAAKAEAAKSGAPAPTCVERPLWTVTSYARARVSDLFASYVADAEATEAAEMRDLFTRATPEQRRKAKEALK